MSAHPPVTAVVRPKKLPFSSWWPLLCGAAAGLLIRLVYHGEPGQAYSAMLQSFIYLSPLVVGMVTVYVAERRRRRSWGYYLLASFLANVLYVVGSLLILIEGWICAILIVPLFATIGMCGGALMGLVCRVTDWPRPTLYSFAALPLLLGALGTGQAPPQRIGTIERQTVIHSPPATVWKHLMDADRIRAQEVDRAWTYRIGVPTPLAGVTRQTPTGLVRDVRMDKGIHFQQLSTDWQPQRRVHWQYHFASDSVPPRALDDHVRIGGDYFDLQGTTYTLTPQGESTALTIRMDYRVSTGFNWYAEPIAQWLIGNFSEVILDFYRKRSEADRV